jgi:hypothetical protein
MNCDPARSRGVIARNTTNKSTQENNMNNKFDELAKGMAQSVTRRGALKKFGVGLAGMALACFGLANKAGAAASQACLDACKSTCSAKYSVNSGAYNYCYRTCVHYRCIRWP